MGQAKKYNICTKHFCAMRHNFNICTKYFWARRTNTILALSTFGQGEKTQYLQLFKSTFGPGEKTNFAFRTHGPDEKTQYLHFVRLGQANKNNTCTKHFWARRKSAIFALSTFGPGEQIQYLH